MIAILARQSYEKDLTLSGLSRSSNLKKREKGEKREKIN